MGNLSDEEFTDSEILKTLNGKEEECEKRNIFFTVLAIKVHNVSLCNFLENALKVFLRLLKYFHSLVSNRRKNPTLAKIEIQFKCV